MDFYEMKRKFMINLKLLSMPRKERVAFLQKYKKLESINDSLSYTVQLDFFSNPDIFEIVSIDKISRILAYKGYGIQELFLEMLKNDKEFLQYVCNQDGWDIILTRLSNSYNSYEWLEKILKSIPNDTSKEDKEIIYSNIEKVMHSDSIVSMHKFKNYLDVLNCNQIIKDACIEKIKNEAYSEEARKNAFVFLNYGFDLEMAINFVKKYGKDLEKMREPFPEELAVLNEESDTLKQERLEIFSIAKMYGYTLSQIKLFSEDEIEELKKEKNLFERLNELKNICETPRISDYIDKQVLDVISQIDINTDNSSRYEQAFRRVFEKAYDKVLYKPNPSDKVKEVQYDGKKIDVYEIDYEKEFSTFLRVEGAYSSGEEPKDYQESLDTPSMLYHGNCKTFCNNSNISIPKVDYKNGVVFGYSNSGKNSINMMAPWDIISDDGNIRFSSIMSTWNLNRGIQFQFPFNFINNTRHSHNEVVSERLIYDFDEDKFKKDKPDFIFYEIDSEHNPKEDELEGDLLWIRTKKAASQLNIPIVLINKEEVLKNETKKIEELKNIFLGNQKDEQNRSREDVLEELIVRFENNLSSVRNPNMHGKSYKEQYFTQEDRENLHNEIFNEIKELMHSDSMTAKLLLEKYEKICQNECSKVHTNTGANVFSSEYEKFYVAKCDEIIRYKLYNSNNEYNVESIDKSLLDYMKKIREPIGRELLYREKGSHSVEHIDRVIIFADMLAKEEGLNAKDRKYLLLAAMFHDCGRRGDSNEKNHAVESAKILKKKFQNGELVEFGITAEDLPIIQTIIYYHNVDEDNPSIIEKREIAKQYCKYAGVSGYSNKQMESIYKMCELLKDADILDRNRFSQKGTLNITFLKSKAARTFKMREFSKMLNEKYAEEILKLNYNESVGCVQEDSENSFVKVLHDQRVANPNNDEIQMNLEELWEKVYSKVHIIKSEEALEDNGVQSQENIFSVVLGLVERSLNQSMNKMDSVNSKVNRDLVEFLQKRKDGIRDDSN